METMHLFGLLTDRQFELSAIATLSFLIGVTLMFMYHSHAIFVIGKRMSFLIFEMSHEERNKYLDEIKHTVIQNTASEE